jgi:hypothetical protein
MVFSVVANHNDSSPGARTDEQTDVNKKAGKKLVDDLHKIERATGNSPSALLRRLASRSSRPTLTKAVEKRNAFLIERVPREGVLLAPSVPRSRSYAEIEEHLKNEGGKIDDFALSGPVCGLGVKRCAAIFSSQDTRCRSLEVIPGCELF